MKKKYLQILIIGLVLGSACIVGGKFYYDKSVQEKIEAAKFKQQIEDVNNFVGWYEIDGKKIYIINGKVQTGLFEDNNKTYYLSDKDGIQTGWIKVDNNWYCFDDDGAMLTNTTISGCYLNADGLIDDENNSSNTVYDGIIYRTYDNNRFNFSIQYPNNLTPGNTPDNGDGLLFTSDDETACLSVGGAHNHEFLSLQECYEKRLADIETEPALKVVENNHYVISWEEDNTIYYEYKRVNESVINGFTLNYPSSEKDYYDKVIPVLVDTFKTPNISE